MPEARLLPAFSVYTDGRVLRPSWDVLGRSPYSLAVRTLGAGALTALWAEIDAGVIDGFAEPAASAPPGYGTGFTTYVVTVRRSGGLATAWTTSASPSPAARALAALGDKWTSGDGDVPAEGWVDRWSGYDPADWYLTIRPATPGTDPPSAEASVLEPFIGAIAAFGVACPGFRGGTISRATNAAMAQRFATTLHVVIVVNLGGTATVMETTPVLPDEVGPCAPNYLPIIAL